jgi:protein-S-isoprenylcysteine O-methyltransferase Ste14
MIWARQSLGQNWSGAVVLQEEHTLTRDGPYRFVRHPIYSGGLLAMLGSALVLGQAFDFVWVAFCAFGLIRKAGQEEGLLSGKFPAEYVLYKKQTKMLIPFIW